ncbi:MAG: luciferase family protein [Solirubrobacteraceae bacterium]
MTTSETTSATTADVRIIAEVRSWPGVTTSGPGERGELSLMLGRHEIGHLHGDRVAHFAFGRELGARLREEGHVVAHPITDKPTLGARPIRTTDDVSEVIELFGLNYERIVARYGLPERSPSAA